MPERLMAARARRRAGSTRSYEALGFWCRATALAVERKRSCGKRFSSFSPAVLGVASVKSDAVKSCPLLVTAEKIGQMRHAADLFLDGAALPWRQPGVIE